MIAGITHGNVLSMHLVMYCYNVEGVVGGGVVVAFSTATATASAADVAGGCHHDHQGPQTTRSSSQPAGLS